jgi:hypothetical protein
MYTSKTITKLFYPKRSIQQRRKKSQNIFVYFWWAIASSLIVFEGFGSPEIVISRKLQHLNGSTSEGFTG